jgi:hypothetical protein
MKIRQLVLLVGGCLTVVAIAAVSWAVGVRSLAPDEVGAATTQAMLESIRGAADPLNKCLDTGSKCVADIACSTLVAGGCDPNVSPPNTPCTPGPKDGDVNNQGCYSGGVYCVIVQQANNCYISPYECASAAGSCVCITNGIPTRIGWRNVC